MPQETMPASHKNPVPGPMKRKIKIIHFFSLFLIFFLIALFYFILLGNDVRKSSCPRLSLMGINLHVFFEDPTLSVAEKDTIIRDYGEIIVGMKPDGMRDVGIEIFGRGARAVHVGKQMQYSAKYLKRPSGYEELYGLVGSSKNGKEAVVVVPKELSDGYKAAIELANAHKQAFVSLPEFIQLMNRLDEGMLPPVRELFYLHGGAEIFAAEINERSIQEFVDEYNAHRYAFGSLLEMTKVDGKLVAYMYVIDAECGSRMDEMPIIYDGGRWKIFITLEGR